MRTTLLTLTVAASLMLGACGDDGDTDIGVDPDPAPSTTAPPDTLPPDTLPPDTLPPDTLPPDTLPPAIIGDAYPIADLTIIYQASDEAESVTYRISCLGDTATIIGDDAPADADTMCTALNDPAVRDRLVNGPTDGACTEIYGGPQTANVSGTYDGVDGIEVDTDFDRANGCGIADWDLLTGILPPPT